MVANKINLTVLQEKIQRLKSRKNYTITKFRQNWFRQENIYNGYKTYSGHDQKFKSTDIWTHCRLFLFSLWWMLYFSVSRKFDNSKKILISGKILRNQMPVFCKGMLYSFITPFLIVTIKISIGGKRCAKAFFSLRVF